MKSALLFAVLLMGSSSSASAQKKVSVSGEYHGNLGMDLSDNGNDGAEMAFNTTRMYVTVNASLNKMFSMRTTLDFENFTGDATGLKTPLLGYIKYAYFTVKPLEDMEIRFGQQPSPWIGVMDKIMGYRYVYKTGLDYYKLGDSADTGLSVVGSVFDSMIQYQVGVFNGVGYKTQTEGQEPLNLMTAARLSVYPLAGQKGSHFSRLGLHLYGKTEAEDDSGTTNRTMLYGGALSFNHKYVDLLVEFMMRSSNVDGDDGGMLVAPYLKLKYGKFSIFWTYSMLKEENSEDTWSRIIAGATFDYSKNFAVSLNYQTVFSEKNTKDLNYSGLFLNTLFKF
ncbi:OprO/OprP family phosphate-selective porin [Myxococcota bacterium]|nr:OprO/OprP family phosphate-selective porin [Myxococcota bacterium]MBU1537916.1 OprO/OprP family phosphate-selective porin [Myxococcota bacterium]